MIASLFPLLTDPVLSPRILRVNATWYRPRVSAVAEGDYKVEGDILVARGKDEVRQVFEAGSLEDLFVKMNVFLEGEKHRAGVAIGAESAKEEAKPEGARTS